VQFATRSDAHAIDVLGNRYATSRKGITAMRRQHINRVGTIGLIVLSLTAVLDVLRLGYTQPPQPEALVMAARVCEVWGRPRLPTRGYCSLFRRDFGRRYWTD
jgi:hypothetical protein